MATRRLSLLVGLALLLTNADAVAKRPLQERPQPAWQVVITSRDRDRLRQWRQAWLDALAQVRSAGRTADVVKEGALLQPDAALDDPAPPDGSYRCRVFKLGAQVSGGTAFAVSPAAECRLAGGRFSTDGGAQRPDGLLWPFDGVRLLFLGTMAVGDERLALPYGRDSERDMVGVLERIDSARWRLVLPRPQWGSQIDVVELVPTGGER